ncbi:VWA domain-containing protein [Thalassoroseus pseudoceratinae]|uniref:VWA domain-containing protein n=1 Tax=Thalassoroseus pseudoceratinae TaxID=2713176 RepID=UPI001421DE4D|nr:VWA domain-containing protein [Thalassoroseus pseudoceratinae]
MSQFWIASIFAATTDERVSVTTEKLQYDLPKTFEHGLLLVCVAGLLIAYVVWMYLRDTKRLSPVWTVWLLLLRVGVLVGIAVIYLNPHNSRQTFAHKPSQVAILLDRSLSMRFPAENLDDSSPPARQRQTRTEAVVDLLANTPLLDRLSQTHQVQFYVFSRQLQEGPKKLALQPSAEEVEPDGTDPKIDRPEIYRENRSDTAEVQEARVDFWKNVVTPTETDQDTRLGESLVEVLQEFRSKTASGIIVVSDGASNAGIGYSSAIEAARGQDGVKIFTIGVGSTDPQRNVTISSMESPTLVHTKDAFEISAYVQGQNFEGETVEVILKAQRMVGDQELPPEERSRQTITLGEDGVPTKVVFDEKWDDPQTVRYVVEAQPTQVVAELKDDDNQKDATVNISEKRTRVLLVAGGPMRDYRFLSGMLMRHQGIKVDAYLQSIDPGTIDSVSQDVDELLPGFPTTMQELNGDPTREDDETGYDVIVFFDPDWKELVATRPDTVELLQRWVSEFSGGIIFVAGDVFTPDLATAGDNLEPIQALYPVFLSPSLFLDLELNNSSTQAWPLLLEPAGATAGFLQVADSPQESIELWTTDFPGFYRCYPTAGAKAGATVYSLFGDSRMMDENGRPILLASQIYGTGRTMYLGSAETWRLREMSVDYHERLWTKMIREVGQGRRSRGSSPVTLLPEKREVMLGETVVVRAILLDNRSGDLVPSTAESVTLRLIAPNGEEVFPEPVLYPSGVQPGEFVGDFRATTPGRYTLKLPVPGTESQFREETVEVVFPGLEDINPEQNVRLLTEVARQTGGEYFSISEAAEKLPPQLTDQSRTVPRHQRIETLWDRQWVLYLLVGLLSMEWLTRKLLRLA